MIQMLQMKNGANTPQSCNQNVSGSDNLSHKRTSASKEQPETMRIATNGTKAVYFHKSRAIGNNIPANRLSITSIRLAPIVEVPILSPLLASALAAPASDHVVFAALTLLLLRFVS